MRGGYRAGAGRKKSDSSNVYKTVGLSPSQWAWLNLWFPGGSPSDQVRALLDRSCKFWPAGPAHFRKAPETGDVIDKSGWVQTKMRG